MDFEDYFKIGYRTLNDILKENNIKFSLIKSIRNYSKFLNPISIFYKKANKNVDLYSTSDIDKIVQFANLSKTDKTKIINKLKYGVENHSQLESSREISSIKNKINSKIRTEKRNKTNLKKYKTNDFINSQKSKETIIKKHGSWESYLSYISNYRKTKYKEEIKKFELENDCTLFCKEFKPYIKHSAKTINYCVQQSNIKFLTFKNARFIKNSDISIFKSELYKISKNYSHISVLEKEITDFIKLEYIENDRTILNGQELDIYIPSKKLAIEFDGLYWHSSLFKDKDYHINKTIETEKQGIKLIHILEDDWLYKKEISKSIVNNNLGIYFKTINANDCKIIKINKTTFKNFCKENYISDFYKIKTTYGVFYNDNLIYVFNIKIDKDNFIIYDFVSKLNTNIINVLCYFINYINKTCILYADRRFYNQNDFNGYSKIEYTSPRKFYIKNRKRYNFISNTNTIYDCGLLKITFSKI